ncbi:MAG: hypothetical protein GY774_34680 [Planctomycetes bacterium]|nr:hypothetical protein [Planctomycetota bacterium]
MHRCSNILILLISSLIAACTTGGIFHPSGEIEIDEQGGIQLSKSPYQCYLAPEKVIVGAELPKGKSANLVYWEEGHPETSKKVPFQAHWDAIYHAVPEGLDLSKSYACSVEMDGKVSRPFLVKPGSSPGENFTFFVFGDTRSGNALAHRKLVEQMKMRGAAFYIHTGDFVHDATDPRQWNEFLEIERPLLEKMPIVPVAGNHDISDVGIFTKLFFRKKRFYSFEYANSLVIVLDSTMSIEEGDRQHRFLKEELESLKNKEINHVFVIVHHPPYSSGKHGDNKRVRDTVVPLLQNHNVVAVFSGHDHSYERTKAINGIVYVVTGGGGAPMRPITMGPYSERILMAPHFVEIAVSGESVYLKTIDQYGKVVDETRLR